MEVIFDRYNKKFAPHFPVVVFPFETTIWDVLRVKPILGVCVLAAASHGEMPQNVSRTIAREAVDAIAEHVVVNGTESIELVQAMQVTAIWFNPTEVTAQTNFSQIVHMAAVMSLNIGLDHRFHPAKAKESLVDFGTNGIMEATHSLSQRLREVEARRAWLGCYYLCTRYDQQVPYARNEANVCSMSLALRRPNLVRWSGYLQECVNMLEYDPSTLPSDTYLCHLIKIQYICEKIQSFFSVIESDDNSGIRDPKIVSTMALLEAEVNNWRSMIPTELWTNYLRLSEHVARLYLHEIALHRDHYAEDFRLPVTEGNLASYKINFELLSPEQISALETCVKSAHGILDTILDFDVQMVRTVPILCYFGHCVYALVLIIKMHLTTQQPGAELAKLMKLRDFKVSHYLKSLTGLFASAAKGKYFTVHPKILQILFALCEWFEKLGEEELHEPTRTRVTPFCQDKGGQVHMSAVKFGMKDGEIRNGRPHIVSQTEVKQPEMHVTEPWLASQYQDCEAGPATGNRRTSKTTSHALNPETIAAQGDAVPSFPYCTDVSIGLSDPSIFNTEFDDFDWDGDMEQVMDVSFEAQEAALLGDWGQWFSARCTTSF